MQIVKSFLVWSLSIYLIHAGTINVPSDQITIQAGINVAANGFTFDILHAKVEPIDHDLYVSPDGNDLNSGTSSAEPLRTISAAISKILSDSLKSNTIFIAKGIYSTSSGEYFPLNMKDYVSLSGESKEHVILDAEDQGGLISLNSVKGNKIENLSLTGGSAYAGGAINCTNSDPILSNLSIYKNTASHYGGGIYCKQSSPTITNVTIFENKTSWGGGGIFCITNSHPVIKNVTISRNTTKYWAGAVYSEGESNPHLINTILWNNFPHEIRLLRGDVTIEYSDVKGGKAEIVNDTTNWLNEGNIFWFEGNIEANPLLCDPLNGSFTLAENSPCIGSGKDGNNIGAFGIGCGPIIIDETASVLYVSVNGSDEIGDGSYDNPFATVQQAIDFMNPGDTILVNPGIYFENLILNKKGIVLGSFFMTTGDTSYISKTVINGDSSSSVVFISSGDSTTVLSGFTITNGNSDEGGGIYCLNSSPVISNVKITGNIAGSGGGISSHNSKYNLVNSVINNNRSLVSGGGLSSLSSYPVLKNVIIKENISEGSSGGCSFYSSVPHLKNVTITGNTAYYNGGGISLNFSSAIFDSSERCNIYLNYGGRGSDIDFFDFDEGSAEFVLYADTFTVKNPTDYHVYRIDKFDILHGKLSQANKDLYVSPAGNNDNSGETPTEPLRSISLALSKIKADSVNSHTVYIAEGKYSLSETGEHFPLNMADNVSLYGESSGNVILDAKGISGVLSFDYNKHNIVENLTITGGYKFEGGGISCVSSNPDFVNVAITGNKAIRSGGGMNCSENSYTTLENCTISNNEAELGGGISFNGSCALLLNTILWDNSPDEICFLGLDYPQSCVEIAYTNVLDDSNRINTNNNGDIYWREGNFNSDPLFCNSESGNYFLAENSPCIGTGKDGKNIGALPIGCDIMETENKKDELPAKFGLFQNYPNPFNPSTTINYEIPAEVNVTIKIYDIMGREIELLLMENQKPGKYEVEWNGENYVSGVYFYSIQAGDFFAVKKLILLK